MSRTRLILVLLVVVALVSIGWIRSRNNNVPEVSFTPVARETLVSTLSTNGKVEPSEFVSVRADNPGILDHVAVQKGQRVPKGGMIAELDSRDARTEVASAEAAVAQAKSQLETLTSGGSASARVEIENELGKDRLELATAQRDHDSLKRLAEKHAATGQEVLEAANHVQMLENAIQALERKRAALVGGPDRASAQARVRETEAALAQARLHLERTRIYSPMAGVVYELPVRDGVYVNSGDLIANIGNLRTLRVRIYVDEPELGRVAVGLPVTVTWDALAGRTWKGTVEKLPTEIVALGTRQVGEVTCTIENDDLRLLPGTNVNVEITSQVVEHALTIPKEAIRTENGRTGVYVLNGERVEWRDVRLGAASITRAVVVSGLSDGDRIALRTDEQLHAGERVRIVER